MMSYPLSLPSSSYTRCSINMATVASASASACLIPSYIIKKPLGFHPSNLQNKFCSLTCRASSSSSSSISSSMMDFDLYDLLGIDSTSDQSQIKVAYRSLQKRCHPDIAGPAGHDMAIILNDAYAILSDPNARLSYDKEHAKSSEFKDFTGRPIYSVWCGSESEQRAIFVDEIKCIGCLKCALLAEKTFAIESVYGRARVVAQWADSPNKIDEAIESCPVNCISVVERSNLAALEFLMSKQPRGNVRVGAAHTAGARISNIFVDVEKFQTRFQQATEKTKKCSKETDLQRESRMSAIQAIRSISNWLYWQTPRSSSRSSKGMTRVVYKLPEPDISKIRDAVAMKKVKDRRRTKHQTPLNSFHPEEYWTPSTRALPSSTIVTSPTPPQKKPSVTTTNESDHKIYENQNSPIRWGLPMVTALTAVVTVQIHNTFEATHELQQHVAGSLALDIVNSSWLQCTLAAATWYIIGMAITELLAIIGNENR